MGSVAVVIVAAGSGTRLGAATPKAFVPLSGRSLLSRAISAATASPQVLVLVVVAPSSHLDEATAAASSARDGVTVRVVPGGYERSDSVAAGLAALPDEVDVVLVHDAARALAPTSLFTAVIDAVRAGHPAVVPGLPVVDTIKQVSADGLVVSTPDRAWLRAIQTPQGFTRETLTRAHDLRAGGPITDDAALVERLGLPVHVIDGDPLALKITTGEDLLHAETQLERNPA